MASYTTSALRALRALTGASAVREIDTGFASLAADVDAAITWARDARTGYITNALGSGGLGMLRSAGGDISSGTLSAEARDLLWLDKTPMIPAARGWEWRIRSRLWVNDVAVPAGVSIRAAIAAAVKATPVTHDVVWSASATLVGTVSSAAALAASSVVDLTGAWTTAPDTAVDGVDWVLLLGPSGGALAANGRVYARSWLEARFT